MLQKPPERMSEENSGGIPGYIPKGNSWIIHANVSGEISGGILCCITGEIS